MDKKLKARPSHVVEFINYTMSMYEECDGLQVEPEDIKRVIGDDISWKVDCANKKGVSEKGIKTLAWIVDMHAEIIDVIWDD